MNIGEVIADMISGLLGFFGDWINNIFVYVADINLQNKLISSASTYTTMLGIALITLAGVKQYFTTYVMETSGDPDSDPLDILVRCSQAVAICCSSDFIFTYFLDFSKVFVTDFAGTVDSLEGTVLVKDLLLKLPIEKNVTENVFMTIILALVIGMVAFCIIAGIRGAELSLMKILLPIMAVDLVTTNRERWNNFITTYIMTFLYYGLQLLAYKMFLGSLGQVVSASLTNNLIVALGWFVIMLRSPRWLEKFVYSTGLARGTGGVLRTASFFIPRLGK